MYPALMLNEMMPLTSLLLIPTSSLISASVFGFEPYNAINIFLVWPLKSGVFWRKNSLFSHLIAPFLLKVYLNFVDIFYHLNFVKEQKVKSNYIKAKMKRNSKFFREFQYADIYLYLSESRFWGAKRRGFLFDFFFGLIIMKLV